MGGVFLPFVAVQIVTQPGAGRTDPGEKQQRKPEIIAVFVEERTFCAARGAGAMASGVFLLWGGRTAMNASRAGSRASSSVWSVANCVTATRSGATPDPSRITRSNATFAGVRPITPTLCPARSAISLIFGAGCLLEPLPASPEGDHRTTKFF